MINGILLVDKEDGYTSFDVVARVRTLTGEKKAGHTGTLDPSATGLLPICLGKATKVCDLLMNTPKEYIATLFFGYTTDTQDDSGNILSTAPIDDLTEEKIREAVKGFIGIQMQVPPMYSARKINGRRLYEMAREGKVVEREAKEVTIHEIEILKMELPTMTIRVVCSKGTYIRTLCNDIGQALGCGATMTSLQRTKTSGFHLEQAHKLSELFDLKEKGKLEEQFISVDSLFSSLPSLTVYPDYVKTVENGGKIPLSAGIRMEGIPGIRLDFPQDWFRVYLPDGRFVAIYEGADELHPKQMFFDNGCLE